MALFRPYERTSSPKAGETKAGSTKLVRPADNQPATQESSEAAELDTTPAVEPSSDRPVKRRPVKKDAPTRTRAQAEAERMERLHATPDKKADRAARRKARHEAFEKQENEPRRRLLRDYLDSRWTLTEFLFPLFFVLMAGIMLAGLLFSNNPAWLPVANVLTLVMWALMVIAFVQTWMMWRDFKRLLAERHPKASTQGLGFYMFNRALMPRAFRTPAPQVARGERP